MNTSGLVLKLTLAISLGTTSTPVQVPEQKGVLVQPSKAVLSKQDAAMLERATPYLPMVKTVLGGYWPDHPYPVLVASTIEQESLWRPNAELCVPKPKCTTEYGFGFGQLTITPKFNAFTEVKNLNPALRDWSFEDRHNPQKQVLGILTKARANYKQCKPLMADEPNVFSCVVVSYNGGYGGFLSDRRICSNTEGCNPKLWFNHVEHTSLKAKVAKAGYGKSFFQINREYAVNVLKLRPVKYETVPGFHARPF